MNSLTYLERVAPGMESYMFIMGIVLLVGGIIGTVAGLVCARLAHTNKADTTKLSAKADAFYLSMFGLYGLFVGGLAVVGNFASYSSAGMSAVGSAFVAFFVATGFLCWRYVVASRKATKSWYFDEMVWHFFNG